MTKREQMHYLWAKQNKKQQQQQHHHQLITTVHTHTYKQQAIRDRNIKRLQRNDISSCE